MTREALAPLLRCVGTSLILTGALIGFLVATREPHVPRPLGPGQRLIAPPRGDGRAAGSAPAAEEEITESLTDRVMENPWFESLGFVGAAVVSSSFYVEYLARRRRTQ